MEVSFDLPTKRANVEIGSGSGSDDEARKKAKTDVGFDLSDVDFSKFRNLGEFCEKFCALCEDSLDDLVDAWTKWEHDLREHYRLREIKLFLVSEGRRRESEKIQSLNDKLARNVELSWEFRCKGWILRPVPGSYDEYQRLYVGEWICNDETGVIMVDYGHLYCTHRGDSAFLEYFKELQHLITWDMRWPDVQRIVEDVSENYVHLPPETLLFAINELLSSKEIEQRRKERVPFYTKLWLEVVKEGRDGMEVLKEIVESDAALYPAFKIIIEDELRKHSVLERLRTLEHINSYINAAPKESDLSENYEELIHKYFHRWGPDAPQLLSTYVDYLERKMKVAKNLELI